jgi:hypothetical protein
MGMLKDKDKKELYKIHQSNTYHYTLTVNQYFHYLCHFQRTLKIVLSVKYS